MNLIPYVLSISLVLVPLQISTSTIPEQPIVEKNFDVEIRYLAKKYNQDEQLARKIIDCEGKAYKSVGNNKNYDKNGNVWSTDVGYWQINNYYNEKYANGLGLDIYNEWDNLEFGFIMLSELGTKPWNASRYCWGG